MFEKNQDGRLCQKITKNDTKKCTTKMLKSAQWYYSNLNNKNVKNIKRQNAKT